MASTNAVTAAGRSDRRTEILEVATRLFCERTYHQTTLDDVALEIGFTKPAIYYYFSSKEEILFEIHNRLILVALDRINAIAHGDDGPTDRLRTMLRTHIRTVLDKRDAIKVFYAERGLLTPEHESVIQANRERYEAIFWGLYDEGVAAGEFRPMNARVATSTLLGACRSTYQWVPDLDGEESEVTEQIVDLLTRGFTAD